MKKITVIGLVCLLLSMTLFSCRKENAPVFVDTPVVESYLYPGDSLGVRISRQIAFSSSASYSSSDINALSVTVTVNDTDNYLLTPMGNGVYKSGYRVRQHDRYQLHFSFNDKDVSGSTVIPSRPSGFMASVSTISIPQMGSSTSGPPTMPDPVKLSWNNSDTSYYLVVVENIETNPTPIRDTSDGRPQMIFRNQPTTSNLYEIRSMSFQYYGTHRLILYHLNPDYAYLYGDNNNSSQTLTTPQSDITNGLGIFTGINSDTLWLEVTQ